MLVEFEAQDYHADGSFQTAAYAFEGDIQRGWSVRRNDRLSLELGPGYELLHTVECGVCATDLARQYLPFPLPQIIGHEVLARDASGTRYAVEINASHRARGLTTDCPFCEQGLSNHCPSRLALGINALPGGFGPYILVPVASKLPVPDALPSSTAVLLEPFAAALHAVNTVVPSSGMRVAILGPRRLGMLVVAALNAYRARDGAAIEILALSRHRSLLDMARDLGADQAIMVEGDGETLPDDLADVVIDTTGSPSGLQLATRLARHEVHLKSTHGHEAAGLANVTQLVVDELSIARWEGAGALTTDARSHPYIAWCTGGRPPPWRAESSHVREGSPGRLLADLEALPPPDGLPRFDAAVVAALRQVDSVIRPHPGRHASLVRPRGAILIASGADDGGSALIRKISTRGLRLSTSRCGDFRAAMDLLVSNPRLRSLGRDFVTDRFPASELTFAFEVAKSPDSIKTVIEHERDGP